MVDLIQSLKSQEKLVQSLLLFYINKDGKWKLKAKKFAKKMTNQHDKKGEKKCKQQNLGINFTLRKL